MAPVANAPLPSDLSDLPDVVATQGRFLAAPISTPTFASRYDANFTEALHQALRLLADKCAVRRHIYRDKGAESRLGHTPPALQVEFQAAEHQELRDLMATMTPATPSTPRTPHSRLPSLSPATTAFLDPVLSPSSGMRGN